MFRNLSLPPSLLFILLAAGLFVLINPSPVFDLAAIGAAVFAAGHVLLKEKILLLFLIARPALDFWRDTTVVAGQNVNAVLAILFFGWAMATLFKHRAKVTKIPLLGFFTVTGLWFLYSATYSLDPLLTIIETVKFLNIGLIFFLSYIFVKQNILKPLEIVTAIAAGAAIPLLTGLSQIIFQTGITTFEIQDRIFGTFAHPNVFAFFVMFLLFLHHHYSTMAPTVFWEKHHFARLATYGILILLLLLTYTRAAWVGLAIYAVMMAFLICSSWRVFTLISS